MIFGLLNVNKPSGRSSRWVVNRVSRITGVDKIGHAGTLDPLATGILLMALGPATRLIEYLQAGTKVYQADIHLGVSTSTHDAEGEVISTLPVPPLNRSDLEQALARFVGVIEQQPPVFSALKVGGVAAYRKARAGQAVELPSRRVRIEQIELLGWQSPVLTARVTCAPGTYIRTLACDLGQALGCGAHLASLVRQASGHFRLEDSVGLETLAAADDWQRFLLPPDQAVLHLTPVYLDEGRTQVVRHGNSVTAAVPPPHPAGRAYDPAGRLIALVTYDAGLQMWRPDKVFDAVG